MPTASSTNDSAPWIASAELEESARPEHEPDRGERRHSARRHRRNGVRPGRKQQRVDPEI
jgi:hypothetical protein